MAIQLSWTGADSTFWDLTNGKVRLSTTGDGSSSGSSSGVEGFGEPDYTRMTVSSAGRDGQRRVGLRSRAQPRSGLLPVIILADTVPEWYALSAGWRNSWSPDNPGTLAVTMPNGQRRTLQAYLQDDDKYAPLVDPTINLTESVAVTWVADDPWWKGDTVTASFTVVTGTVDFFNGGAAPPFNLAAGNLLSGVRLNNPGDLEAWPTYTLTGPATGFSVTLNGHTVSGNINVATGQTLVVNTDPSAQVAFLYGSDGSTTNVTPQLTAVDFGFIPSGLTVPTSVVVNGTGQLSVSFQPRYRRAW